MDLHIRDSFFRDWENISNRLLDKEMEALAHKVRKAYSVSDVYRMKKLIGSANRYKIELRIQTKIYWVLCQKFGNRIDFYRIKSEDWCKKHLKG